MGYKQTIAAITSRELSGSAQAKAPSAYTSGGAAVGTFATALFFAAALGLQKAMKK